MVTGPGWVAPMLAVRGDADLADPARWRLEEKLDGLRCLAVRDGPEVTLWSRNRLPFTARFAAVVAALRALPADRFVLDGEVVALDASGRSNFSALQRPGGSADAVYFAFDLLHLLGRDTTGLGLDERVHLLGLTLAGGADAVRVVGEVPGSAEAALERACRDGWEGLVAKRRDGTYRSGRSSDWRKLKCSASQEMVVGGWTAPTGSRHGLGALLVGVRDGDLLRYAGRVGTGFAAADIEQLTARLAPLAAVSSPFAGPTGVRTARWVRPELVVAVRFSEWTPDGRLRHPSYLGPREDRDPSSVVRETSPLIEAARVGRRRR